MLRAIGLFRKETIAHGLLVFLLTVSLAFGAEPPLTYSATTRKDYIASAPAPALQAAPYAFYESAPAFRTTRILRVTDANTFPSVPDRTFWTADGNANLFNSDDTRFIVRQSGSQWIAFNFDAATFTAGPIMDGSDPLVVPLQVPWFSYQDPNVVYGASWSGIKLQKYDFAARRTSTVVDLAAVKPGTTGVAGLVSVSKNERIAASFGGPGQDNLADEIVYDVNTGDYKILEMRTGQVYNSQTGTYRNVQFGVNGTMYKFQDYPKAGVHSSTIDGSGRYVVLAVHGNDAHWPAKQAIVWDTQSDTFACIDHNADGHYDIGYGYLGGVDGSFSAGWVKVDLHNANATISLNPGTSGYDFRSHYMWNNTTATNPLTPLFASTGALNSNHVPWTDEIIGISTSSPKGLVYRFTKTHMIYDPKDWYAEVRGNISPDGRFFIFDSNWDDTLGTDPHYHDNYRHDVFIVDLLSAGRTRRGSQ